MDGARRGRGRSSLGRFVAPAGDGGGPRIGGRVPPGCLRLIETAQLNSVDPHSPTLTAQKGGLDGSNAILEAIVTIRAETFSECGTAPCPSRKWEAQSAALAERGRRPKG